LVEAVKNFQRASVSQKELWVNYSTTFLGGIFDPARHDEATLREFCVNHGVEVGAGAAPAPRPAMGGGGAALRWGAPAGGAGGGGNKANLVERVKNFQRMAMEQKELWVNYVNTYLGGTLDPNKHEAGVLQEFCDNQGVPEVAGGGGGGVASAMASRSIAHSAGWSAGGGAGAGGAGGAQKAALVDRIKNFQRASAEQKELWVNYATTYLGGTFDPNKHDASLLEEFCTNHSVPEAGGGGAASGGGYRGGGGGHAAAGPSTPEKVATVERIKNFQRASQEQKELWVNYATQYLGGTFDPNKQSLETLEEFCVNHDVP
jgi:hypothetical protein